MKKHGKGKAWLTPGAEKGHNGEKNGQRPEEKEDRHETGTVDQQLYEGAGQSRTLELCRTFWKN